MVICPKCKTEYAGAERFCPKDGTRLGTGEGQIIKMPSIPPDMDPLINTVIQGRYRVSAQIGEGGMGVVYEAEHVEIEKKVALKVLRDDFSKKPEVVARFRQEAKSAGKIGNAHIVDVTDFGQLANGGVYFVMEHLQGEGLNDLIRDEQISLERGVHIVLQIAKALRAAHKLGIVHRDLKPENIFLIEHDEEKDFVKILDFGIAKISDRDSEGQRLTKTGMIFGTPEYMSPEQASGKELDQRVDIYALGCIMFEMFTGRVPFEGETFMAVLTQHMFEPPPDLESVNPDVKIPDSVKAVIYKAMAKEKAERYSDMVELAEDLERAMSLAGVSLRDNSSMRRSADYRLPRNNTGNIRGKETRNFSSTGSDEKKSGKKAGGFLLTAAILGLLAAGYFAGIIKVPFGGAASREKQAETPLEQEEKPRETQSSGSVNKEDKEPAAQVKDTQESETAAKAEDTQEQATETENVEPSVKEKLINTKIISEPAGGVVLIEGMGQVCSSTPCEMMLEEGKPVDIEVRIDRKSETMTFTPSLQNKEVILTFTEDKKPQKRPKSKTKGKNKSQNSGLKIPKIFRVN